MTRKLNEKLLCIGKAISHHYKGCCCKRSGYHCAVAEGRSLAMYSINMTPFSPRRKGDNPRENHVPSVPDEDMREQWGHQNTEENVIFFMTEA